MKRWLLATTSLLALGQVSDAADLSPRPMPVKAVPMVASPTGWTGFYAGIQGGVVSHRGSFTETSSNDPFFNDGSLSEVGGTFGGNAGYNVQSNNFVWGIEGDISWVGAKATGVIPAGNSVSFDVSWLTTIRGRAGLLVDRATLLYATGGVAFGRVKNSILDLTENFTLDVSKTRTGWTAGGGIEHKLTSNWSIRGEARYVDLGRSKVCSPSSCTGYTGEFKNTLVQGLVGLEMKF